MMKSSVTQGGETYSPTGSPVQYGKSSMPSSTTSNNGQEKQVNSQYGNIDTNQIQQLLSIIMAAYGGGGAGIA
jgi:hypothetical protein